ncbi:ERF family protein [Salipiger pacificus]|nr:ERF family protein [Alloyangia pacifica]
MNAVVEHQAQTSGEVLHIKDDPMVAMIERIVLNPDADLDKLERMLAMKERMDANAARVAFSAALAAARAEIPTIHKDATVNYKNKGGGSTSYAHETLSGIAKIIDPILAKYGISYRFRTGQDRGTVTVTCIVQHSAGHSEETSLSGHPDTSGQKNGFQAVGSAVTYLQRYTLKAALGISAEKDDDAQGAGKQDQFIEDEPRQERQPAREEKRAPSPAERTCEGMIASIRQHGADSVESDERFRHDLSRLRIQNEELAARVDFALKESREESRRQEVDYDPKEIGY